MKILITGAEGKFGRTLAEVLGEEPYCEVIAFGRDELDVTNEVQTYRVIRQVVPDVVIHAAAYTAVDQAETEEERAYRINAYGTRNVAVAANEIGAKVCYVSTDYVFDGMSQVPYREFDALNPLSVYGRSKKAGERLIQTLCSRYFVVRTSWLYGEYGKNFVTTMLELAQEDSKVRVVHDQTGSPTYAVDLAKFLGKLVATQRYGIYHATNTGSCSWYEFARTIFDYEGIQIEVEPCTTEQFPRPAPRPHYSVLEPMAMRANDFELLRDWRVALKEFLSQRSKG